MFYQVTRADGKACQLRFGENWSSDMRQQDGPELIRVVLRVLRQGLGLLQILGRRAGELRVSHGNQLAVAQWSAFKATGKTLVQCAKHFCK